MNDDRASQPRRGHQRPKKKKRKKVITYSREAPGFRDMMKPAKSETTEIYGVQTAQSTCVFSASLFVVCKVNASCLC